MDDSLRERMEIFLRGDFHWQGLTPSDQVRICENYAKLEAEIARLKDREEAFHQSRRDGVVKIKNEALALAGLAQSFEDESIAEYKIIERVRHD